MADIDTQLAEQVFGFVVDKTPKDYDGNFGGEDILIPPNHSKDYVYPPKGRLNYDFFVPKWSESFERAWRLVCALNRREVEVIIGCFPPPKGFQIELRRWRDRRSEGVEGDPDTHRSRETFVCVSGDNLSVLICEAVLRSGLKLPF